MTAAGAVARLTRLPTEVPDLGPVATFCFVTEHTRRFAEDIVRYADVAELVILPAPQVEAIMPTDFAHAHELIAAARGRARSRLARGGNVVQLRRAA